MAEASSSAAGSSQSSTNKKVLKLQSSDNVIFEITEAEAKQSAVLKDMLEAIDDITEIPALRVNSEILCKVIEYCEQHANANTASSSSCTGDDDHLKKWDKAFMDDLDKDTLFDIMRAAHYLDVTGLLDLTCQTVADKIKMMNPEVIRNLFAFNEKEIHEEAALARRRNTNLK